MIKSIPALFAVISTVAALLLCFGSFTTNAQIVVDKAVLTAEAYTALQRANITGASIANVDKSRLLSDITGAYGFQSPSTSAPLYTDNMFRMGNSAEIFVYTATLMLIRDSVLPSLDTAIPSTFMPGGIALVNPNYPGTSLTLRHLLTHTSTLTDSRWTTFSLTSPSTVVSLSNFATSYYLTGSPGSYSIATDIWTTQPPSATATSYNYAKANIALLMFIIETAVVNNNLVSASSKTCLAYVAEKIWIPLGMSNTFVRYLDGTVPTSSYPAGVSVFSSANAMVEDKTATGTASAPLHPAYFAADMTFSTPADVSKLMRALFSGTDTTFTAIGTTMRSAAISLTTGTAQTGIHIGVKKFDGSIICGYATQTLVVDKCPLDSSKNVWGVSYSGTYTQFVSICSDASSDASVYCSTVATAYTQGKNTGSITAPLGTVGISFQLAFGDLTTQDVQISPTETSELYGLWVFLIVFGCLIFIFIAAWLTEKIVGPAHVSSGLALPPGGR